MPVENIIQKINADAEGKIRKIDLRQRELAKEERDKILRERDRRMEDLRKRESREIKVMTNRIISQARLNKSKEVLAVREEIMEDVFRRAAEKTNNTDLEDRESYLRQAIGKVSSALDGKITIRCSRAYENLVRDLVDKIDPGLTVKADLESTGGIIGVSEDGISIDLTLETNLERKKKRLRKEICDILFTEEG